MGRLVDKNSIKSYEDIYSIDMCEKSVLQTAFPTIREAVSKHLSEISKKKRKKEAWKKERL